jgi:formate dehydrogenase gamma subunit
MSSYKNIPLEERQRLRQKRIRKHHLANILTHWFNVGVWLLLLPTGLAIMSSPRVSITPLWMQDAIRNIFGGPANLIKFHYTVGLLWIFVLGWNVLLGFRKYFLPFAQHRMMLDKDDIEWLKIKPLQMLGFMKGKPLPPQDEYNAGQKLYMYVVLIATAGIMLTGVMMTFHSIFPPFLLQWAQPLHFVCVGAVIAGLMVHVYMGAFFPEEKESFFSMFTGEVSAWFARAHHEKWYWRKIEEEMEWEERVRRESQALSEQAQPAADPQQPG